MKFLSSNLLLILLSLVVDDVVEAKLVDALGGRNDAQPVTQLLLLEVLLGPISPVLVLIIPKLPIGYSPCWRGKTYRYLR